MTTDPLLLPLPVPLPAVRTPVNHASQQDSSMRAPFILASTQDANLMVLFQHVDARLRSLEVHFDQSRASSAALKDSIQAVADLISKRQVPSRSAPPRDNATEQARLDVSSLPTIRYPTHQEHYHHHDHHLRTRAEDEIVSKPLDIASSSSRVESITPEEDKLCATHDDGPEKIQLGPAPAVPTTTTMQKMIEEVSPVSSTVRAVVTTESEADAAAKRIKVKILNGPSGFPAKMRGVPDASITGTTGTAQHLSESDGERFEAVSWSSECSSFDDDDDDYDVDDAEEDGEASKGEQGQGRDNDEDDDNDGESTEGSELDPSIARLEIALLRAKLRVARLEVDRYKARYEQHVDVATCPRPRRHDRHVVPPSFKIMNGLGCVVRIADRPDTEESMKERKLAETTGPRDDPRTVASTLETIE